MVLRTMMGKWKKRMTGSVNDREAVANQSASDIKMENQLDEKYPYPEKQLKNLNVKELEAMTVEEIRYIRRRDHSMRFSKQTNDSSAILWFQ